MTTNPYITQNTPMGQGGQRNSINPYSTNNQQNTQMRQGGQKDGANPYFLQTTQNQQNPQVPTSTIMGIDTKNFLIGAAIGAAGAYLLTNENAQKAIFKTIAQGSSMFQAGIEEIKERFEDAKAELEASK
jgi:hypothetical protein